MKKAAFLMITILLTVAAFALTLKDVPKEHWAYEYVTKLVDTGIVVGYPDGTFKGKRYITRYEMTAFIARTLDYMMKVIDVKTAGLKNDIALVDAKTQTLVGDLAMIKKSITALAKNVYTVRTKLSKVDELESKLEELNYDYITQVGFLKKGYMGLSKKVAKHDERLTTVEDRVGDVNISLIKMKSEVEDLKKSVKSLSAALAASKKYDDELEKKIKGLESKIDDVNSYVEDSVSFMYDELDSLKGEVQDLLDGLVAVREDFETELSEASKTLGEEIDANTKKIGEVEKKADSANQMALFALIAGIAGIAAGVAGIFIK